METNRIPLKLFLNATALVILTELAGILLGKYFAFPPLILIGIIRLCQTGLIVWCFSRQPGGFDFIGLGTKRLLSGLKQGAVWSFGFGAIAGLAGLALYLTGTNPFRLIYIALPKNVPDIVLLLTVGGVIGPVAEELVFRGVLYGFFRKWGMAAAMLGSTALFVALHSGAGITQAVGGLVFAAAYEKEKSLVTPMVIHITGNLALFGLSLVSRFSFIS